MAQTRAGAALAAAHMLGIPPGEYAAQKEAGNKWCFACQAWHPTGDFGKDRSRLDGLKARCNESAKRVYRETYVPTPRPAAGRRFVPARDGDKVQARRRIDHLINIGHLPDPDSVPCMDCGHDSGPPPRHEYDHHLGYAAEHHEDVEPVCAPCHHTRERNRRGQQN